MLTWLAILFIMVEGLFAMIDRGMIQKDQRPIWASFLFLHYRGQEVLRMQVFEGTEGGRVNYTLLYRKNKGGTYHDSKY